MKMKLLVFNILIIIYGSINAEISQLRHVQIIYRHGDRTPVLMIPTDSNKIDKWPLGLGQLTNQGIIRHFNLGLWLRKRYNSFLGNNFHHSLMHVRSSNLDRTLMSAESNLAGFFFNSPGQIIKGLNWRPTPIHTVDTKTDLLLRGRDNCKAYKRLFMQYFNSSVFQKKFEPHRATFDLMKIKTGIANLTFEQVWKIYDTLLLERKANLKIDDWVTDDVWKSIVAMNRINWEVSVYDVLAKVTGGIFLNEIIQNFISLNESRASLNLNQSKIIIYSGHETNLGPVTSLLGILDTSPPYAACLLFELHHVPSRIDKWAVKVIYKNNTDSTGSTNIPAVILPGCDSELCPLNQFVKLMKPRSINETEYEKICKI